ncbi:MAG: HAMP domain-containing histidine kinase [Oscillospiraceae bacterium]|nr:HAMP domain-containing histidine kinase [Oscillospiraceae bacterium]
MRSIRFQFMAFISILLLILLLLLNTFPLISSRDAVFEEKRSSMAGQASLVASSLSGLDRLSRAGIAEVLSFLDVSGFSRIVVADETGTVVYDNGGPTGVATDLEDIRTALTGKTVFRSAFAGAAFSSSYTTPMSSQGALSGAVYLHEDDAERAEIILTVQRQVRSISLAIAVAALVLAAFFSFFLLERIRALVRSMRIVAGGDYAHRHAVRGRDEITELGKEFNQLTERLETTEAQRRRFVSDASHELKTPLASIRLLSDSIVQNENIDPETMREFVTDIGVEAQRLQRTTEKLLDLSRLDDNVQVAPQPVDVKQVSLDVISSLRPLAAEKNVHLRCELADGCVVMATVDDMYHILFNLMENAIKYNVNDGSVLLELQNTEDSVLITVEDTGIGIPEEERHNIFSRFYRVDKARSREAGGSGLGLSIVHDAVLAHAGSISVGENKPQGSRFVVRFPRPTSEETGI